MRNHSYVHLWFENLCSIDREEEVRAAALDPGLWEEEEASCAALAAAGRERQEEVGGGCRKRSGILALRWEGPI
jgi:hypothetical protein